MYQCVKIDWWYIGPLHLSEKTPCSPIFNPLHTKYLYIMDKYNKSKIEEQLNKTYPDDKYKYFIGCLLGIVDDMNSGKIDLQTPVGEFMGISVERIFEEHKIYPKPTVATELSPEKKPVTFIPHSFVEKIIAGNFDYIVIATKDPQTGELDTWKSKEITVDYQGLNGLFERT